MGAYADARTAVGEVLDRAVSPLLASVGFGPRTRALTYRRRIKGEVTHVLRYYAQTRGQPEGAYVRSSCLMSHDAVRALAHRLWSESPLAIDGPFPDVYNLVPDMWKHGSQKRQWYPQTADVLSDQLLSSVQLDLLPLLDDLRNPGAVAAAWDCGRLHPTYSTGELYVLLAEAVAGRVDEAVARLSAFAERQPASLRPRLQLDAVISQLQQLAHTANGTHNCSRPTAGHTDAAQLKDPHGVPAASGGPG